MIKARHDKAAAEEGMRLNEKALAGSHSRYLDWNLSVFKVLLKGARILDLGCGPGIYYEGIKRRAPSLYYAADYSEAFLRDLQSKTAGDASCRFSRIDLLDPRSLLPLAGERFDYVVCFDVLEHIEDDKAALQSIAGIIQKTGNGTLLLRVPAVQAVYGENDRSIGHFRRYNKAALRRLLEECGFEVEKLRYQNLLGLLPWWFIGTVLKRGLAVSGGEGRLFDMMVPVLSVVEGIIPPPVGLSLYARCRMKTSSGGG